MRKKERFLLVFDVDGVLRVFSWEHCYQAYLLISAHFGLDFARAQCPDVKTYKKWASHEWKHNLSRMGLHTEDEFQIAQQIFLDYYHPKITLFEWVDGMISELAQTHVIAALSNTRSDSIMDSFGPTAEHFSMIVGNDHVTRQKPHPEGLEMIMDNLGFNPTETYMLGDSHADIDAGRAAGTHTVAVTWGATDPEDVPDLSAQHIMHRPTDLLEMF